MASSATRLIYGAAALLLVMVSGCAPSAVTLGSGVVHVNFASDETCGFSNPYTVEARGCRRIDEKAVMCKGFGVIDGVLFAGGCEAPAEIEVLEKQGTLPLSPPRSEPAEPPPEPAVEPEAAKALAASEEPAAKVEKKRRSSSKKTKSKKRKKRTPPR